MPCWLMAFCRALPRARENNELWGASISHGAARRAARARARAILPALFSFLRLAFPPAPPRRPTPVVPSRRPPLCPRRPQNRMHPIFALSFVFLRLRRARSRARDDRVILRPGGPRDLPS